MSYSPDTNKIDNLAVDGLDGVVNSLAYKVAEIERHLHSGGSWFGVAVTPTATHKADRVGTTLAAFQLDGGDSSVTPTWGAWVQLFGSDDTPARASMEYFDPHMISITATEGAFDYAIQISRGATGDAGIAAGTYSEIFYSSDGTKNAGYTEVQTGRAPAGSLIWARCIAQGQNTGTIDFYIGIHEYEG